MEEKVIEKVEEKIQHILDEDINTNNLDNLVKLSKIKHYAKEDKQMNYGNYGRAGYDAYGRNENYGRDSYGRRGYDMKYRGEDELDRMHGEYGRYQESRRYGAGEDVDRSFHYIVKALEDFIKVLYEEAETQPQKQMLRETLQRSMM
jgi:hypothetical protein